MRSQTLTGAAVLMGMLLTGCGAESGPTAENIAGLAADAVDHNTGNHIKLVETFTESPIVNPCNGEAIVFSGVAVSQINNVDELHFEFLTRASGTGTGPESGATYAYTVTAYENVNKPDGVTVATFGAGANARMISSIPSLTFTAHFQFHGVFLPSGEFKVTRDLDRVECKA